jgi:hypothetical protein
MGRTVQWQWWAGQAGGTWRGREWEGEEEINRCGLMIAKCCRACGYPLLVPLQGDV